MAKSGLFMQLSGVRGMLSTLSGAIAPAAEKNMEAAVLELEGEIKSRAPVDTGHLRASYEGRVESSSGDTVVGIVGTNVEYAPDQEFYGTPHLRPAVDARTNDLLQIMGAQTLSEAVSHVR